MPVPDYQEEKGRPSACAWATDWACIPLTALYSTSEKCKNFLQEFYEDSDSGKVYTYAEQLVSLPRVHW